MSSHFPVTVQCEHEGLKQVIQRIEPNGNTARFIASLQQYDLVFQRIHGKRTLHSRTLLELGDLPDLNEGELSEEAECFVLTRAEDEPDFGYGIIKEYSTELAFPPSSTA
jgi:hypothetical protein